MSFLAADSHSQVSVIETIALGAIGRTEIPVLCAELAELLRGRGGGVVICDVADVVRPDVVTVEALARLSVTARRHGWRLVVDGASPDLRHLVGLLGLTDALPEAIGQTEQREQPGGVEEGVDPGDPPG